MAAQAPILPISEISSYQTKWMIKARVTNKAPIRTWSKGAGGKVFSADLLDSEGGEIRASFFNQAVDKFYDMLEQGKCFTFSRGSVKIANKQYNPCNHRYELTFDKDAFVVLVPDDSSIQTIKFSFVGLRGLQSKSLPCAVDLCGIITSFRPTQTVNSRDGQELAKRELTIADDTAASITVTLWAERAKLEDKLFEGNPTVAVKGVYIKEFKETRAGSLLSSGELLLKPDFPEAARVQQWWSQGGSSQELLQLSGQPGMGSGTSARAQNATPTTLAGMRLASEKLSSQYEVFSVVTRVGLVQTRKQGEPQPLHYMACQEPREGSSFPCNLRVDEQGYCPGLGRETRQVAPRLNIRCRFVDFEDQMWLTSFHEAATRILGKSGEEVRALELAATEKGEGGREELESMVRKCYFEKPMSILCRAKLGEYNGVPRVDIGVIEARPVSHGEHGRQMLKEIQEMLAQ